MKIKLKPYKEPEAVPIREDFIKLDSLLKLAVLVGSGGEAKQVILDGLVTVNGEVCTQRGRKIRPGDLVAFAGSRISVTKAEP
jgi:ribosome-associated protein